MKERRRFGKAMKSNIRMKLEPIFGTRKAHWYVFCVAEMIFFIPSFLIHLRCARPWPNNLSAAETDSGIY